jgi:phosphoglycerate dehydrogenase-like enzyme
MKLAILDDYADVARDLGDWSAVDAEVTVFNAPIPPERLAQTLSPFDALVVMRERTPIRQGLIEALPNLKLIVTTGPRNAAIDSAFAASRGITVCGTASRPVATAQLTMAVILAATRNLVPQANSMRNGGWQTGLGRDLDGLKLGLIGLGKQGAGVARLAQAFGMEIAAWSQNLTDARCAEIGVSRAESLDALLRDADVVSIHVVLSDRTRGLIGAEHLAMMKPDALLVNTSRGPIVDEAAILPALRAGRPGQVALDVFAEEPPAGNHPLRDRALIDEGRLLLTPHLGYATRQTYATMYAQAAESVAAWLAGAPLRVIAAPGE